MTTRRTMLVGGAILLVVAAPTSSAQEGAVSASRAAGDTAPRPAATPPDSARGRVVLTGPSTAGFIMLTMADSQVRLAGYPKNVLRQVSGLEIVVFGKRYGPGPFRWPLQMVDSFFVRGAGGRPALDGILRRGPSGDALELRDGRLLEIRQLPGQLSGANGMHVWITEPLEAPTQAGIIDPDRKIPGRRPIPVVRHGWRG